MSKTVYRSNDTLFYNSQCLFVEYHDVIAMPWFTMLLFTKNKNVFNNIFNMNEIANYDIPSLLEWYTYRKHRNIFKNFRTAEGVSEIPDEAYESILEKAMSIADDFYRIPTNLKFFTTLRLLLLDSSMIKQVIIYSETNESMIQETLNQYFTKVGNKVKYMNGKFEDMLKLVPDDSTYVFSDITKINTLANFNKLNLSCVLIPAGLRYNYMENDQTKLKVNLDELSKKFIFKYSFFDNFDLNDALSTEILDEEKI